VPDLLLVEQVLGQIAFAGLQRELIARREREHDAELLTARAIARYRLIQIDVGLIRNRAALATALVALNRHKSSGDR
jgi:hypothetical protein